MDFSFSDEQALLQESVSRFITNDYGFDARQKNSRSELGYSVETVSYTHLPSPRD